MGTLVRMRKIALVPTGRPNSDINVTPLVDVMLVLLIIFMVVTPLMEKDIPVRIPETEQVAEPSAVPPSQLVVSVTGAGEIFLNSEKVAESALGERLARVLAARAHGDRLVFFNADDQAPYALLIRGLDAARRAGAETLAMMTEPLPGPATATPVPTPPSP